MELFDYSAEYRILICRSCRYAVRPVHLAAHLKNAHRRDAQLQSKPRRELLLTQLRQHDLVDPDGDAFRWPTPSDPPVASLGVHWGYACLACSYVTASPATMQAHAATTHPSGRGRGRPSAGAEPPSSKWKEVDCQRFFQAGRRSGFFAVTVPVERHQDITSRRRALDGSTAELIRARVAEQLNEHAVTNAVAADTILDVTRKGEVSPWLKMTRWPKYLHGLQLSAVAPLAHQPNSVLEPLLILFVKSFNRVIDAANVSVQEDKINVFDQARINSFIQRRRASDRPLMIKLQKATWRAYQAVWQRLICFAYRTAQPDAPVQLSHRLTSAQLVALDKLILRGEELMQFNHKHGAVCKEEEERYYPRAEEKELQAAMDRACLLFCISLLDHTLKGDLFESTLIGFLAVLGINSKKQILMDACAYTPFLSGLIKIGQMLVIQRAVLAAEKGDIEHSADLLNEMREQFLIHGS